LCSAPQQKFWVTDALNAAWDNRPWRTQDAPGNILLDLFSYNNLSLHYSKQSLTKDELKDWIKDHMQVPSNSKMRNKDGEYVFIRSFARVQPSAQQICWILSFVRRQHSSLQKFMLMGFYKM
jgi:hypothetical protein